MFSGEAEPEVVADPGPTEEEIDAMTHTEFYTKLTGEVGMHKVSQSVWGQAAKARSPGIRVEQW